MHAMARSKPSKGFLTRDQQRHLLSLHFGVLLAALAGAAALNRFLTPDRMWFQWVALPLLLLFGLHLASFSRATLATMGGARKDDVDS
jgi:cytochrome c biogenesis protein CcdA